MENISNPILTSTFTSLITGRTPFVREAGGYVWRRTG
jgi:hypothetical protein